MLPPLHCRRRARTPHAHDRANRVPRKPQTRVVLLLPDSFPCSTFRAIASPQGLANTRLWFCAGLIVEFSSERHLSMRFKPKRVVPLEALQANVKRSGLSIRSGTMRVLHLSTPTTAPDQRRASGFYNLLKKT